MKGKTRTENIAFHPLQEEGIFFIKKAKTALTQPPSYLLLFSFRKNAKLPL